MERDRGAGASQPQFSPRDHARTCSSRYGKNGLQLSRIRSDAARYRQGLYEEGMARMAGLGHLDIEVTVDDPKAYTRPWTVTLRQQFAADTELIDEVCAEGERFAKQRK